ncbi:MAG: biotin transporter BioY [Rhodospirillales bacterium]|nr:biotin transporter BioY [Rhodospirillales bacterium]
MTVAVRHPTLVDRLWPAGTRDFARAALLALAGSALLWASAKVQVPMWPVPMTMQSGVVLFLGFAYGARLGAATVALYLLEGAFGLPVFAGTPEKGIGIAYMLGTTGGFLAGFLVAAALLGWLAERGWGRTLAGTAAAMAVGTVVLHAPGVAWLATFVGFEKAVALGLTPFIAGAVVKAALATALVSAASRTGRA